MFYSTDCIEVKKVIQIEDIYEEFLKYESKGKLTVLKYENQSDERKSELVDFIATAIVRDKFYETNLFQQSFMKKHFPTAWEKAAKQGALNDLR